MGFIPANRGDQQWNLGQIGVGSNASDFAHSEYRSSRAESSLPLGQQHQVGGGLDAYGEMSRTQQGMPMGNDMNNSRHLMSGSQMFAAQQQQSRIHMTPPQQQYQHQMMMQQETRSTCSLSCADSGSLQPEDMPYNHLQRMRQMHQQQQRRGSEKREYYFDESRHYDAEGGAVHRGTLFGDHKPRRSSGFILNSQNLSRSNSIEAKMFPNPH